MAGGRGVLLRGMVLLAAALAGCRSSAPGAPALPARTRHGTPVRWTGAEITLRPVAPPPHGARPGTVPAAALRNTLAAAAASWNQALSGCRVPRLRVGPDVAPAHPVREDGVSVVVVRAAWWCPDQAADDLDCHPRDRAAISNLYPALAPGQPEDGRVREADLEINAVHFRWSEAGGRSLQALAAHELGHVLGLDHACAPGDRPGVDPASGVTLPPCLSAEARASVMYPDPVEVGRPPVFAPGEAEVKALCGMYGRWTPGCGGGRP